MPVACHATGDVDEARAFLGTYHVNLPITGSLTWRQGGGAPLRSTPGTAAVFQLARVHEGLREADPAFHTVTEIAYRYGFSRMGRFAAEYRARYGAHPRETLRQ